MESYWAVLRCQSRREALAERSVSARGVEAYLPCIAPGKDLDPARLLFPGYLFARVRPDTDELLRVRSVPGVAYVLPRTGPPALLPEAFIQTIRTQERLHAERGALPEFRRGDRVVVVSGPFKWAEGLFDRTLTPAGRVRILLELVHGSAAIQIDALALRQAGARTNRRGTAA